MESGLLTPPSVCKCPRVLLSRVMRQTEKSSASVHLVQTLFFMIDTPKIVSALLKRYVRSPVQGSSNLTTIGAPLPDKEPAEPKRINKYEGAIDSAVVCTGGGGLLAGVGTYLKAHRGAMALYSAEPEGWDDHRLSFAHKKRLNAPASGSTWCDGLLAKLPGEMTFPINLHHDITGLCASDFAIAQAMRLIWDNFGIRLEPSGAIALACLMTSPSQFSGQRVLVTLTGGNVDWANFEAALTLAGQATQPNH